MEKNHLIRSAKLAVKRLRAALIRTENADRLNQAWQKVGITGALLASIVVVLAVAAGME